MFVRADYRNCRLLDAYGCSCNFLECAFLECSKNNKRILIGTVYRPPNGDNVLFIEKLNEILTMASGDGYNVIILCGDFNYDLLNVCNNNECLNFANCMFINSLTPTITKPTRISGDSFTLIDNIFASGRQSLTSGIIPVDLFDHYAVFCIIFDIFGSTNDTCPIHVKYRLHNHKSIDDFYGALGAHDFSGILSGDLDVGISSLNDIIMCCYNLHCPIVEKIVSYKSFTKPWIDRETLSLMKTRQNYFVLFKSGRMDRAVYGRYRNYVTGVIRGKRRDYYINRFSDFRHDMRRSWKLINGIIRPGNKRDIDGVVLRDGNLTVNDPLIVANKFNEHFCSVGEQISNSFSATSDASSSFLRGSFPNSFFFHPAMPCDVPSRTFKRQRGII